MLHFSHKNASSPPPPTPQKSQPRPQGAFPWLWGYSAKPPRLRKNALGTRLEVLGGGGVAATDQPHWLPKHQKLHFPIK